MKPVLALTPPRVIMGLDVTDLCFRGMMAVAPADADTLDRRLGALMRAVQAGDRRAYASLLRECEPVIRRSARRAGLVGDRIEDAVQETLLTLHNARQTYDPSRSFTAWLSVIAQRRAIDTMRRAGRSGAREIYAPLSYERHIDPHADPSRGWQEGDRAKDLRAAVAQLSSSQREAVEHLAFREQSLAEASVETGKTTGALKVNLHRALKALRDRLQGGADV